MSPAGQKTFPFKASLILGLAFVLWNSCTNTVPTWYSQYRFEQIKPLESKVYAQEELDTVYRSVSSSPSYPGGMRAWMNHLKNNIEYPREAQEKGIEGSVFLSFNVKHTGEIRNVIVNRGLGFGCDEEAVRILLSAGLWSPAILNGQAVNTECSMRILFSLPH